MNISTEKKIMDLENRLVAARGEREGVGGIGSLGLSDTTEQMVGEKNVIVMYTCKDNLNTLLYSKKKKNCNKGVPVMVQWK